MKVPPKRKGNLPVDSVETVSFSTLNESPSEKEGKSCLTFVFETGYEALNESPSEKEGKYGQVTGNVSQSIHPQ